MGFGTVAQTGTTIHQINQDNQRSDKRMDFEQEMEETRIKREQEAAQDANDHSAEMTKIEEAATDEDTKLCASCSGQLADFFSKSQALSNAICKAEYDDTMAQAKQLTGYAKYLLEEWAKRLYDPVKNWCLGGITAEKIIERTKETLVSQFGGCDWKCGTDKEFHQMMKQGTCHPYDCDNRAHRALHQCIACGIGCD
jgi:hypothetical protein